MGPNTHEQSQCASIQITFPAARNLGISALGKPSHPFGAKSLVPSVSLRGVYSRYTMIGPLGPQ